MEADDECSGDFLSYRLQGGNMRDQRVQRPLLIVESKTRHEGSPMMGIGIEKRLQRLEKIVGVQSSVQSLKK
ncbi:hypothetical protein LIER_27334 [Lithospermum erythrorhizon]|uniref:Uncharacterized protein n=1 Tax=Lithospermum erythrorhizon TaxID=34254 RepID=A0AAV3RD70_LITER